MKKIVLLIIVLNVLGFSQEEKGQKLTEEYYTDIEQMYSSVAYDKINFIPDSDLLQIARKRNYLYQNFPKLIYEKLWSFHGKINIKNLPTFEEGLMKEISQRFGKYYYSFLEYPYTFLIEILDKKLVQYDYDHRGFLSNKAVITAKIQIIFNGKMFTVGEKISFDCYHEKFYDFKVGELYFVALRYTHTHEKKLDNLYMPIIELKVKGELLLDPNLALLDAKEKNAHEVKAIYDEISLLLIKGY